jgi:hypothetical protein
MTARANSSSQVFGFLTVVDDADHGLLGGYLALNAAGRPLEFHCTAPVKASRAQEILYGPTLAPYLQGELIGGALVNRVKTAPLLLCTDQGATMSVRRVCQSPVVLVLPAESSTPTAGERRSSLHDPTESLQSDASQTLGQRLISFPLGVNLVAVTAAYERDRREVEQVCQSLIADLDLQEPFSRIREALQEARAATSQAAPRLTRQTAAA